MEDLKQNLTLEEIGKSHLNLRLDEIGRLKAEDLKQESGEK